jgi:hypothetical protein
MKLHHIPGQALIILTFSILNVIQAHASVFVIAGQTFENQGAARILIVREGNDINFNQTVEFATADGVKAIFPFPDTPAAKAGEDYLFTKGTVQFIRGQTAAPIEIPLIDNARVDGDRWFSIEILSISPPESPRGGPPYFGHIAGIIDNEFAPTLMDPTFNPDFWSAAEPEKHQVAFLAPKSDRGLFIQGGGFPELKSLDRYGFIQELPHILQFTRPLRVLGNGDILGLNVSTPEWDTILRLTPRGDVFTEAVLPRLKFNERREVQLDGKILILRQVKSDQADLRRQNLDGSNDSTFEQGRFDGGELLNVRPLNDGGILVHGSFHLFQDMPANNLLRLNADGTLDRSFNSAVKNVNTLLVRSNGKILVQASSTLQLNSDGSLDPSWIASESGIYDLDTALEQADGKILFITVAGPRRLALDGSVDPHFAPRFRAPYNPCYCNDGIGIVTATKGGFTVNPQGEVYFSFPYGSPPNLDGFPAPRLVRFRTGPAVQEFRPFESIQTYNSGKEITIRIARTGETERPASVDYAVIDERAGGEISLTNGTLYFATLESLSQFIFRIPENAAPDGAARTIYKLRLSNPTPGYAVSNPTPIVISPDLLIDGRFLKSEGRIIVSGCVPGLDYRLETSTSLIDGWIPAPPFSASLQGAAITNLNVSAQAGFFRVKRTF